MSRPAIVSSAHAVLVGAMVSLLGSGASAGAAERALWWRAPSVQREMNLKQRQVAQLDAIFAESLPARQRLRRRLTILQARLTRQLALGAFEDADVRPLVEQICAVEKQGNIARTMMLVRLSRVLSARQLAQLEMLWKRLGAAAVPGEDVAWRLH